MSLYADTGEEPSSDLPEVVLLHDESAARRLWPLWKALDRQHLPVQGGLADQPERLMEDLLRLDDLHARMERQLAENRRKPPQT